MKKQVMKHAALLLALCLLFSGAVCAAGESGEPSSSGDGRMPYDQVLRLIKWIDDGYYRNRTYDEFAAFTGVEGLDKGHRDTGMTALGDHYFDWIADNDPTHYIHVCFRGRDDSGRFEACQWNTSGFSSDEWKAIDLSDWLRETACRDTEETGVQIQRFSSNPLVTVTVQLPVSGWRSSASSNTAYFHNDRGEQQNDPRIEVVTYDDPVMFDFYKDKWENLQPAESRVIAGVEMQGRTYHNIGWDWTEYTARLSDKVSIAVRISRVNCAEGTEGGAILDTMRFSWTEKDGTEYVFPGSAAVGMERPEPTVTPQPAPAVTETPVPVVTETPAPALTDAFLPGDAIVFASEVSDRPEYWREYSFTNELNGITLSFCMPMNEETGVSDFYAKKDPSFRTETGRAFYYWRYDAAGKTKMNFDISLLYASDRDYDIRSLISHGEDGFSHTTVKTDRGFTLYRRINNRGEAKWGIVSDPLSDGRRVLAEVDANNSGQASEPWYDAIMTAFEGTVTLTVPGETLGAAGPVSAEITVTEAPATEVPATATPAAGTPSATVQPITEGHRDYAGIWYSTWLHTGGMDGDPRSLFGLALTLTLNADGTGELDYLGSDGGGRWGADEDGTVRYWGEGTPMTFLSDGSLCWGSTLGGYILFSRDPNAEAAVFPEEAEALQDTAGTPAPQEPAPETASSGMETFVGVKYVGKTYSAGGVSMDASVLGGEYAILLNADGSAVFTMAGMEMPGYSWKQAGDHVEVDAYGTVLMTLTQEADGSLLMDYSGAFTLVMVPQR